MREVQRKGQRNTLTFKVQGGQLPPAPYLDKGMQSRVQLPVQDCVTVNKTTNEREHFKGGRRHGARAGTREKMVGKKRSAEKK